MVKDQALEQAAKQEPYVYQLPDNIGSRPAFADNRAIRYGKAVDPGRLTRAIFRRLLWIGLVTAVGLVVGVLVARFVVKQEFTGRSQLLWEPAPGRLSSRDELITLVDSVKVGTNLQEIQRRMKIGGTPEVLASRLDIVLTGMESRLINFSALAPTAEEAAALSNTTVQVFLGQQTDLARQRGEERVRDLKAAHESAKNDLAASRKTYDDFRRENGIIDISTETERLIEEAADLRAKAELKAEQRRNRPTTGGRGVDAAGGALADEIRNVRSQISTGQTAGWTDEHPQMVRLKSRLRELESQRTNAPPPQPVGTPRPRTEPDTQEPDTLEARQATEAEQRLALLSGAAGQASQLLAAVNVAESHVAETLTAVNTATDAARNPKPEFRVISAAIPPTLPSKSLRRPIAIGLPMLFGLLSLIVVLGVELRGLRVYTASEVAYWGKGPVVGSSTWPSGPHTLKALVEELGDLAPRARGTTLVVPIRKDDEMVAEAVAGRLQLFTNAVTATDDDDVADTKIFVDAHDTGKPVGGVYEAQIVDTRITPPPPGAGRGGALSVRSPMEDARLQHFGQAALSQPSSIGPVDPLDIPKFAAWKGPLDGPHLRGAVRMADRVLVVIPSGRLSAPNIAEVRTQLGRDEGIGYLVFDVSPDLAKLGDRAGPVEAFWLARRA